MLQLDSYVKMLVHNSDICFQVAIKSETGNTFHDIECFFLPPLTNNKESNLKGKNIKKQHGFMKNTS